MKINYDPQTDTAYIKLSDGKYKVSKKVSEDIVIDYDENDVPLGIEILSANEIIPGFNLNEISLSISNTPSPKVQIKNAAE
jgi:uncharacterized protein YuzE